VARNPHSTMPRIGARKWACSTGLRRSTSTAMLTMVNTASSPDELVAGEPDVVLVFVSELVAEARAALPQVERRGGTWVDAGAGR
jgi:hypothetical protein